MVRRLLLFFNSLMGIGAAAGSSLALIPSARESVGLENSMLVNSPFTSFLIPGLFLLLVLSIGNILVGFSTVKKIKDYPYFQCLIGLILCLWIIIQCVMIWSVVLLHVIFFVVGCIQFALGLWIIKQEKLSFPFSAHQN